MFGPRTVRIDSLTVRTRIKICGLRRAEDALVAAQAGADAIGLVFYARSSRVVTLAQACDIAASLPAFVSSVALFLDADAPTIKNVIAHLQPDTLQFHGGESAQFCRSFGLPYLKAVPMQDSDALVAYQKEFFDAKGLLLDSHGVGEAGGRGIVFDWSQSLPQGGPPLILAGGLQPANVAEAIATVRPYAVDVSSGVESAPGIKHPARIRAFIKAVQQADCEQ